MTVLRQAIEKVSVEISKLESTNRTEFGDGFLGAWREAKELLESLLPEEEKQIREAWEAGEQSRYRNSRVAKDGMGYPFLKSNDDVIFNDLETYIANLKK